jgi:hypothetical protein
MPYQSLLRLLVPLLLLALILSPLTGSHAYPTVSPQVDNPPQPYMEYVLYNNTVVEDPQLPPVLRNGFADYHAIFERHNICELAAAGEIDEVWIWVGDGDGETKAHFWEWTTSGPGWTPDGYQIAATPNCGHMMTTMAFNYFRLADAALHSYGHRIEGALQQYLPCDFSTATWPWEGNLFWEEQCGSRLSDSYGYVARPFADNNHVAACGDIHFPPNITDSNAYRYNSEQRVQSICQDWSADGSAGMEQVSCFTWGCNEQGFMLWWMQNLPNYNAAGRTSDGRPQPNWWDYLFGLPDGIQITPTATSVPTATPQPGYKPTATATSQPGYRPTATSVPTATPQPGYRLYQPLIIQPAQLHAPGGAFRYLATQPEHGGHRRPQLGSSAQLQFLINDDQPAQTQRTVFVIALTGYGNPRDDVRILTDELITLLKRATIPHGYRYNPQAVFLGQDGGSFAGADCTAGTEPDNIHIRIDRQPTNLTPVSYRVDDPAGGGVWTSACVPGTHWQLHVEPGPDGVDLYFKPFRFAPAGTRYYITIRFSNDTSLELLTLGEAVQPAPVE